MRQAGSKKYKYKDKHKDVICFWKGDDNRSLIMKNVVNIQSMQNIQNMQNMQNTQNMQNMQNMQSMQNIPPLFFLSKDQKSKICEPESSINSRTCLAHLVLFN